MYKPKTSLIWTTSTDDLSDMVDKSDTITEILTRLECNTPGGANVKTLKARCASDGIDLTHIYTKTSKVHQMSLCDFKVLVRTSSSYSAIITTLGYDIATGGPLRALKKRLKDDNIDFSHLEESEEQGYVKGLKPPGTSHPIRTLKHILVENSTYTYNQPLKIKLMEEGLLTNMCSICNILPDWNGEKLVLQLDHINGTSNDNRIENLRMLCPNCHSQTDTFCRQNKN